MTSSTARGRPRCARPGWSGRSPAGRPGASWPAPRPACRAWCAPRPRSRHRAQYSRRFLSSAASFEHPVTLPAHPADTPSEIGAAAVGPSSAAAPDARSLLGRRPVRVRSTARSWSARPGRPAPAPRPPAPRPPPLVGHRAVLQHHRRTGDVQDPVDLLLDDQQRRPGVVDLPQAVVDGVDHRPGPGRGRSRRPPAAAAGATRTLASDRMRCSPPESVPPCWRRRSPEHREGGVGLLQRLRRPLAPAALAEGQHAGSPRR